MKQKIAKANKGIGLHCKLAHILPRQSLLTIYKSFIRPHLDYGDIIYDQPGLSMNILCAGDKSPVQRSFFTNSTGDLLPALGFLDRLYNFCNFVIIFNVSHDDM